MRNVIPEFLTKRQIKEEHDSQLQSKHAEFEPQPELKEFAAGSI